MPAVAEIYRPNQTRSFQREVVGSQAFNLEYTPVFKSRESIRSDIVSYLGEYRFKIPKFEYSLFLVRGEEGDYVADSQGNSMEEAADRAIIERKRRGDPIHRELSERQGLDSLKTKLQKARQGDGMVWGSPPGPKDEGYGDYGFVYSGKVGGEKVITLKTGKKIFGKELRMEAIRVEEPVLDNYNAAFSRITGEEIDFSNADEYLRTPLSVSDSSDQIDGILKDEFSFKDDEVQQKDFENSIRIMEPLINRVVWAIQNNAPNNEKIKLFYALENYAIALKNGSVKLEEGVIHRIGRGLDDIVDNFGRIPPPAAAGSCGSTNSRSNRLFGTFSSFSNFFDEDEDDYSFDIYGACITCGRETMCGPCMMCQACDSRAKSGLKLTKFEPIPKAAVEESYQETY